MKKFSDVFLKNEPQSGATSSHKLSAECFTKCAKWKLSCTLTYNKTSTGLIFQGKAFFLKKTTSNILTQFQMLDNVTEISKSTMKNIEEKAYAKENNTSDEHLDYANIKFPLNNEDSSSDILTNENGPGSNVLFFEFCINSGNISKEHLKCFREINNDYVDKELHFVLNATIHGKPMFQNEIRFSLEARKFIKSMQFRLKNYKNDFVEKQRQIQRSNPNFEIKNSKFNFFTKIISNPYIGVEFNKPNFENVEIYPTNFNSIVNSSITVNRLFLEISIPTSVMNPNSKKNEENSLKTSFEGLMKSYSTFTNLKDANALGNNTLNTSREKSELRSAYKTQTAGAWSKSTRKSEKSSSDNLNYYYPKSTSSNKFSTNIENNYLQQISQFSEDADLNPFISKSLQNFNNKFYQLKSQEVIQSNMPFKRNILQILLTHYETLCNFLIFAQNCTPYVHQADTHLIDDIKLSSYFGNFDHAAAFGIDMNYIFNNSEICQVNYSPTLSSMMIVINDVISCDAIIKELNILQKEQEYQVNDNLKISLINEEVKIEYYETKPPHSRYILSEQFQMIMKSLKSLEAIDLAKVDKTSWFCILWSPFKSSRAQFGNTSFLVYYQFSYSDNDIYYRGYCNYMEIPLIGILPVKFEEGIWLKRIRRVNFNSFGHSMNFPSDILDFKMALNDSINNVHEFVFSNMDRTSVDYEFYVKSNATHNSMMSI